MVTTFRVYIHWNCSTLHRSRNQGIKTQVRKKGMKCTNLHYPGTYFHWSTETTRGGCQCPLVQEQYRYVFQPESSASDLHKLCVEPGSTPEAMRMRIHMLGALYRYLQHKYFHILAYIKAKISVRDLPTYPIYFASMALL